MNILIYEYQRRMERSLSFDADAMIFFVGCICQLCISNAAATAVENNSLLQLGQHLYRRVSTNFCE
jgi:hypothetical protein